MENQTDQNLNPTQPVLPVTQTPPVSSPISPPVGGHKSKLPILIIGIILFFLVAGSAAGFYVYKQQNSNIAAKLTPTPIVQKQTPTLSTEPLSNWRWFIYENTQFNYWLKKPDGVGERIIGNSNQTKEETKKLNLREFSLGNNEAHLDFIIYANPMNDIYHGKTCQIDSECLKLAQQNYESDIQNPTQIQTAMLGRTIKGIQYTSKAHKSTVKLFAFQENGKMVVVYANDVGNDNGISIIFHQILSTFLFDDNTDQIIDTTNWKTYTGKGFQFQYPSGWTTKARSNVVEGVLKNFVDFEGPEGGMTIPSGSLGGGCEPEYQDKREIDGKQLNICHLDAGVIENYSLENWQGSVPEINGFSFYASANPGKGNASTIKKILSTFKFTN